MEFVDLLADLNEAITGGDVDGVKALIIVAKTTHAKDDQEYLWNDGVVLACKKGSIPIIQLMLDEGASATDINYGLTHAIRRFTTHQDVIEFLLSKGAKCHTYDFAEMCREATLAQVKFIEEHTDGDVDYTHAIMYAIYGGNVDVVKYLISKGGTIDEEKQKIDCSQLCKNCCGDMLDFLSTKIVFSFDYAKELHLLFTSIGARQLTDREYGTVRFIIGRFDTYIPKNLLTFAKRRKLIYRLIEEDNVPITKFKNINGYSTLINEINTYQQTIIDVLGPHLYPDAASVVSSFLLRRAPLLPPTSPTSPTSPHPLSDKTGN